MSEPRDDSKPSTKLSALRMHMEAEEWDKALKLAASWPRLGRHKKVIERGWEACARPAFYREIKLDPDQLVRDGVAALVERYGE